MGTKALKNSPLRVWILPIVLFLICAQDALFSKLFALRPGTLATASDLMLAGVIFFALYSVVPRKLKHFVFIPVCLAIGDLFYGLSNYIFKWPFPNQLGCLTYVIPYMTALVLILMGLHLFLQQASAVQKRIFWVAGGLSLAVLVLTTFTIIIPALFFKQPALSPLLKTLTVLFSALESMVIGASQALHFFSVPVPESFNLGFLPF